MNVEEYLRQNYNCDKIDPVTDSNGQVVGYYAVRGWGGLYIPTSAVNNSDVGMVSYIPGSGGSKYDAAKLRERIENNPPNYIISMAQKSDDKGNCLQTGYNIAQGLGANVTNNVTVSFSAGGGLGVTRTEEFLRNNPNVKATVIACEPGGMGRINGDNSSAIINSNTPVIIAGTDSDYLKTIETLKKYGINAYLMETDYSKDAHISTNRDILEGGILDYILGNSDSFDTTRAGGYEFLKYDPNTGQIVNANFDEIQGNMTAIPSLNNVLAYDAHTITTESSQVNDKYSLLKNVNNIGNSQLTSFSSSYKEVYNNVNDIRSNINATSFVGSLSTQVFRSGEGIPGCIGENLENFYDAVGSFLNTLSLETESMMSYAEAIVKIDQELAKETNKGKEGKLTLKDNSDKVIPIGLEKKEKEADKEKSEENKNDNKSGNNNDKKSSNNGGHHSSNHSSHVSIPHSSEQKDDKPLREGPCYDNNVEPTYVYTFGDYEGYIYTDPNNPEKIIGIKYRYPCQDNNECMKKLIELKQEYKDKNYINDIFINNNYVDLVFKEEVFKDKTLEEITQQYFQEATKLEQYEEVK